MKKRWLLLGLFSLSAIAQQPPAPQVPAQLKVGHGPARRPAEPHEFISAQGIAERIAKADAAVASGKNYDGEPLLLQDGHRVTMEWRNVAQDSVHAHVTDAEMFVIMEGSGTITVGGTLVNPRLGPAGPYEGPTMSAATATGGRAYKVTKGDMIMIPENTAHSVTEVNGKLVLWSMIMPRAVPGSFAAKGADPTATSPPADGAAPAR
jgi:mannose-6-phosphate isomerase-like protein (cupin superfamily)